MNNIQDFIGPRKRISRDEMFCKICQIVAQRSTCLRSQVGALIVKDGRIISMGYNGPVSGTKPCIPQVTPIQEIRNGHSIDDLFILLMDQVTIVLPEAFSDYIDSTNICEGPGCTRSLHAETNAIAFAARAGVSVEGCTMYCSMSPCVNCAKVIANSGIKELKYFEEYRDTSGLDLLRKLGIKVEKVG